VDGEANNAGYLLDNARAEAGQRFDALAELFDDSTFRHLRATGLARGWRVWEVGAGGMTVASWLAEQVGPEGQVLATDIDTSWTGVTSATAAYQVMRHDVGADEPPPGLFDLVHARLVLVHVAQRDQALASMVSVLRPGGWLVIEDADPALQPLVCLDETGAEAKLANRLKRGFRELLAERGADLGFGRSLPRRLRAAGLVGVGADAYFPITGPAGIELERATTEQIREQLIAAGLASEEDVDAHLANVVAGKLDLATSPMISAWGQKAPGPEKMGPERLGAPTS
jgi:SAM-dependent methyltransferase